MTDAAGGSGALRAAVCAHDELIRQMLHTAVEQAGFDVRSVTDQGADLAEAAGFLDPDLIVLDHDLPWKSGLEWLPELHAAHPLCAILLISNDPGSRERATELGAFGVVFRTNLGELSGALGRARAWLEDPELRKPGERRTGRDRRVRQEWSKVTRERRSGVDRRST